MEVKIITFGQIEELIGSKCFKISNVVDRDALVKQLLAEYPTLQNCTFSTAINKAIVSDNKKLNDGDVIALLPPFSGG